MPFLLLSSSFIELYALWLAWNLLNILWWATKKRHNGISVQCTLNVQGVKMDIGFSYHVHVDKVQSAAHAFILLHSSIILFSSACPSHSLSLSITISFFPTWFWSLSWFNVWFYLVQSFTQIPCKNCDRIQWYRMRSMKKTVLRFALNHLWYIFDTVLINCFNFIK